MKPSSSSSSSTQLPSTFTKMSTFHLGPVYCIKFSYSGQYIMSASQDRSVSLYNPNKNIMIKNYKNLHNYDITCLDICKDNSKFCTGGGDKLVMIMDVLNGKQLRKFIGHNGRVNSLCYGADQNIIISSSYDTTIKIWDNRSNNSYSPIQTLKGFKDSVTKVISNDYEIIGSSMDGCVKFFDVRKGEIVEDRIKQPVQKFAMSNSQKAYAMSTAENKIILCETVSGKQLNQYSGHNVATFSVDLTFTKHDNYILTGSVDGKLYVYDLMRKTPIKSIQAHSKVLSAIGIHQNSGIATGSHDGSVCYWKI